MVESDGFGGNSRLSLREISECAFESLLPVETDVHGAD